MSAPPVTIALIQHDTYSACISLFESLTLSPGISYIRPAWTVNMTLEEPKYKSETLLSFHIPSGSEGGAFW